MVSFHKKNCLKIFPITSLLENWPKIESYIVFISWSIICNFVLYVYLLVVAKWMNRLNKTGIINDPLGHLYNHDRQRLVALFWKVGMDVHIRMDEWKDHMCENSDHYRPWRDCEPANDKNSRDVQSNYQSIYKGEYEETIITLLAIQKLAFNYRKQFNSWQRME